MQEGIKQVELVTKELKYVEENVDTVNTGRMDYCKSLKIRNCLKGDVLLVNTSGDSHELQEAPSLDAC